MIITITWQNGIGGPIVTDRLNRTRAKAWLEANGRAAQWPPRLDGRILVAVDYDTSKCRNVAADRDWLDRMDGLADAEGYDHEADPHW